MIMEHHEVYKSSREHVVLEFENGFYDIMGFDEYEHWIDKSNDCKKF